MEGACVMIEYKLYKLDRDGHIAAPAVGIYESSNEAAITAAQRLASEGEYELWRENQLIKRLPIAAANNTSTDHAKR
jgi:hypothetical protein